MKVLAETLLIGSCRSFVDVIRIVLPFFLDFDIAFEAFLSWRRRRISLSPAIFVEIRYFVLLLIVVVGLRSF